MCKLLVWTFAAVYAGALVVLLIGHFGLFGQERDPLAGVFLLPLGLPWNRVLDWAPGGLRAVLAALAPALNLAVLAGICSWLSSRRR